MFARKSLIAAVTAVCCLLTVSGRGTVKDLLLRDLTDDYDPDVDPGNIDLKMTVTLLCSRLDSDTGHVVSTVWEYYTWKDTRLRWTPSEYDGVNSLRIPAGRVWTPDMREFASATTEAQRDPVNVALMSDGTVIWVPRVTYTSICAQNSESINCDWRIGSWTYDGNNVRLAIEGTQGLDLSYYNNACPLTVENHTAAVVPHTYPCCEETYPSLDVSITFKARQ